MAPPQAASLMDQPGIGRVLLIAPHDKPVTIKLLIAATGSDQAAFEKLVAASPQPQNLQLLTEPGTTIWGEPLVTQGEVTRTDPPATPDKPAKTTSPAYVVDTITLPFENRFKALFFCGGHQLLPDGRAAVCTLHGDVWLVDGIDEKLERITWRRFATGLFQPLGLKILKTPTSRRARSSREKSPTSSSVVGRDQITRLHDLNGDGEADFYENFNNDSHVTLNGHEYVACLEADRAWKVSMPRATARRPLTMVACCESRLMVRIWTSTRQDFETPTAWAWDQTTKSPSPRRKGNGPRHPVSFKSTKGTSTAG